MKVSRLSMMSGRVLNSVYFFMFTVVERSTKQGVTLDSGEGVRHGLPSEFRHSQVERPEPWGPPPLVDCQWRGETRLLHLGHDLPHRPARIIHFQVHDPRAVRSHPHRLSGGHWTHPLQRPDLCRPWRSRHSQILSRMSSTTYSELYRLN